VAEFAHALRQLRVRAGTPSYRALSRTAGYSSSALCAAASGAALPSLELTLAYAGGCGGVRAEWEARWLDVAKAVMGGSPAAAMPRRRAEPAYPSMLPPLVGDDPTTVGAHRLLARIGVGRMGRVYLGAAAGGYPVAVTVVRGELAEDIEFRRRFRRDVAAAGRVRGRFTARVVDADADAARPWLATNYVAGPSLEEAVARFGPLPAASVWSLLVGVAEALRTVWAAGLVHRDLRPANVLLARSGPRVIDFGIARALDPISPANTALPAGLPAFMAPEHVLGKRLAFPSDVFALGALMVFAATGRSPFGDDADAARYRVVHESPRLTGLPRDLRELVAACLEKNPERRLDLPTLIRAGRDKGGVARIPSDWLPEPYLEEIRRRSTALASVL